MKARRAAASAQAVRGDLIDRLGADRVWIGAPAREICGLADSSDPVAVVRPSTLAQVQLIMKIGRARHVPVVIKSNLPAIEPMNLVDVIVLDTRGLDRPPSIDISRRVVTVGAGVSIHAVDRAARQARLCLRGVPALLGNETIGGLLGSGDTGSIGLGDGSLLSDVVSLQLVAGSGRLMKIGHASLLASVPWRSEGLPDASGILIGASGRLGVITEVTLRLQPAPWVAWSNLNMTLDRSKILAILSGARLAISKRVVDTVLVDESGSMAVRASTWRGESDLDAVTSIATKSFERYDIEFSDWQSEQRRVRLGYEAGQWPAEPSTSGAATLEVRMSWPDATKVLDVSDALIAAADSEGPQVHRVWAMGADYIRLRHCFNGQGHQRHPLIRNARYLLDAGAVPVGLNDTLRTLARERMESGSKVLLTGLARVWDPDGVLGQPAGLV